MKALNRAIARTTGDITKLCAFHIDQLGTQGCAVKQTPETLKQLEQHLAALLEMERKQLEVAGMKFATLTGDGTGEALPELAQHLRTARRPFSSPLIVADRFITKMPVHEWAQKAMTIAPRDSGEARKLGITPARIMAQMHPGEGGTMAALEKACDAASNFAREGARYLLALQAIADPNLLPSNGDPVVLREYARKAIDSIKGGTASEQPQLPAYQVGDMLERVRHGNKQWTVGKLYEIQKVDGESFQLLGDDGRPYWTRQDNLNFSNRGKVVPPAPDVIDMTDPRNWQVGDVLMCSDGNAFLGFNAGDECAVTEKLATYVVVRRDHGTAVALHHGLPASKAFTWLRHGEAQQ